MEQRDQTPEQPGEDIGRAAAEAMAQAESGDGFGGDFGHGGWDDRYTGAADYPEPAPKRSKRWLVVGGVTVAALALAGTAAAIAGRSHSSNSATQNVASSQSPTPPATSAPSTSANDTTVPTTPMSTSAATTPSKSASSPTSPTSPTSPSKTPSSTASSQQAVGEGGDCETTTHDTPADEAMKFTGMTKGTQQAFLNAQKAAEAAGQSFELNSGYRSAAYQQRIFDCWVKQLGSPEAARQYALPPDESAHVQGYAMDIAPPSAAAWLQSTAGKFGLCRRYEDETWHFEYQPRYKTEGCPALLPHP